MDNWMQYKRVYFHFFLSKKSKNLKIKLKQNKTKKCIEDKRQFDSGKSVLDVK